LTRVFNSAAVMGLSAGSEAQPKKTHRVATVGFWSSKTQLA
jgi:hypothetical protein